MNVLYLVLFFWLGGLVLVNVPEWAAVLLVKAFLCSPFILVPVILAGAVINTKQRSRPFFRNNPDSLPYRQRRK
jgi:hypothetical protein